MRRRSGISRGSRRGEAGGRGSATSRAPAPVTSRPSEGRRQREMSFEDDFEALRPTLFALAYRMLGSVSEAEDIVQDAFLRGRRALVDGAEIDSSRAYLSAVDLRAVHHRTPTAQERLL